jgi:hypothetical protein
VINERRSARRYDLSLPIVVRVPLEKEQSVQSGQTRDISTHGVFFTLNQDLIVDTVVDLRITLPADVTGGAEAFIRAKARVLRLEKKAEDGFPQTQVGVAAILELYEIIRNPTDSV